MQLSKLDNTKICSEIFYRIVDLKILADFQESTCFGVPFSKVQVFIPQFVQLGLQHELFFLKMLQKFQKSQFFVVSLCSSFWIYIRLSQLILPTIPLVYEKLGDVSGEIVNLGFFVVVERDGPVLKYGFVGRVDSKSIRMATNLFLLVHLIYYIRQSFTQYTACN